MMPAVLPGLSHVVDSIEIVHPDPQQAVRTFERFPDTSTLLFFTQDMIAVAGPFLRARRKTVPRVLSVALKLKPAGASVLFDVPMSALAGSYARLDELWGDEARRLLDELLVTDGVQAKRDRLLAAVHRRAGRRAEPSTARLARRAMAMMQASTAPVRVEALASSLGVTSRHLRRVFTSTIGLGPKEVARVLRLGRAMRAARSDADWGGIAARAGFYDQAHMIADFRVMLGTTPERYRQSLGAG